MNDLEASKQLAADFRAIAREDLDQFIAALTTGQTDAVENPFTGESSAPPVQQRAIELRNKLEASGLTQDESFMALLQKTIEGLVVLPVFSLATAFDGEGAFASNTQWQIALDGKIIEPAIHDFFYEH